MQPTIITWDQYSDDATGMFIVLTPSHKHWAVAMARQHAPTWVANDDDGIITTSYLGPVAEGAD